MDMNNYVGGSISPYGSPENEDSESYARRLSGIPINKTFKLPSTEQMEREVATGVFSPESIEIARSIQASAEGLKLTSVEERGQGILEQSLYNPDQDSSDWWAGQEIFGAPLTENYSEMSEGQRQALREQEVYKRDRSRAWREEAEAMVIEPKFDPAADYHKKQEALYRQALEAGELIGTQQHTVRKARETMGRVTESITPATAHFKQIAVEAKKTTKAFKKLAKAVPKKPEPGANLTHRPFLILSAIRDEFTE